jgi:hypothetical protein
MQVGDMRLHRLKENDRDYVQDPRSYGMTTSPWKQLKAHVLLSGRSRIPDVQGCLVVMIPEDFGSEKTSLPRFKWAGNSTQHG